jgi:cell division protein FtsZ
MADRVLYSGVACITDLMVKEGLINLDFADVRAVMREMGKAMMGTGEATGEKRALRAAEAAIANPLLDDVCMKGARGLLISITGGSDLTLYEVDEAATRIREEVDQDANVIFGATRDDSLEGIVRVSVVATGIDSDLLEKGSAPAVDAGIAEVAERLRTQVRTRHEQMAQAQRPVARIETQPEPAPAPQVHHVYAQPEPAPVQQPMMHNDVTLRPMQPKASYEPAPEPVHAPMHEPAPLPAAFIPPRPEEVVRPPRMPRVDELPLPGQRIMENRAPAPHAAPAPQLEKKRVTLMERLAAAGFGRRDGRDEPVPAPAQAPAAQQPQPRQAPPQQHYAPPAQPQHPAPVHQEYAKRQAPQMRAPQGGLDMHGRPNQRMEDDQLEIPAFLRRQSN